MGCGGSGLEPTFTDIYEIPTRTLRGEDETFGKYRGKVVMIVNFASKCGFAGQLKGLEELYQKYKESGFVVLGFPSNDFLGQEPHANNQIEEVCSLNYGVTFPLFEKIAVKGKHQNQLYAFLTSSTTNPGSSGKISWNFNKFLIGVDGRIVGRYGSRVEPNDKKVDAAIKDALTRVSTQQE